MRLYRPFPTEALLAALPASARRIAVLDRTKEPGSLGEPLFLDVLAALAEAHSAGDRAVLPTVIGGRYGLGSKEFTPGMVAGVFAELARERPRPRFTIGITDDVTGTSLPYDPALDIEAPQTVRAVFFGLGSDGTVGANKNTIKILGADPRMHAQGYFVYDSKKSGSQTVSHLRFGPEPIRAPYLVAQAGFVGCHHFGLLERVDVLDRAAPGATLLLNCPHPAADVWDALPRPVQEQILAKRLDVYAIDADRVAREAGLAGRTNTVLQTCFFAISGVLPRDEAIERIKASITKTYGRRGADVVARNHAAVDQTLAALHRVTVPGPGHRHPRPAADRAGARAAVRPRRHRDHDGRPRRRPAGQRPAGRRHLPERHHGVTRSATSPTWSRSGIPTCASSAATAASSARTASSGPSSTTRPSWPAAPAGFPSMPLDGAGPAGHAVTRLAGLPRGLHRLRAVRRGLPGRRRPASPTRKAINLAPGEPQLDAGRENIAFFETLPVNDRSRVDFGTVRGTQFLLAAVRVLRRLRRLRRDALPQAAVPAVRRPADNRQRHRLLLDLRRQPAHHPVDHQRPGPRTGLVELAVRGQRRVRARLPPGRRPAHRAGPATG